MSHTYLIENEYFFNVGNSVMEFEYVGDVYVSCEMRPTFLGVDLKYYTYFNKLKCMCVLGNNVFIYDVTPYHDDMSTCIIWSDL